MNHNPGQSDQTKDLDLAAAQKARKADSGEDSATTSPKAHAGEDSVSPSPNSKLRALLDNLDLTPEQTKDDLAKPTNRDSEIMGDVPPHHGN